MARPRVFVSSTFYDLKHVRASLEAFIESLGFDAVLSEKGDIAYSADRPLDESCYAEVGNCDIFVLIVGGRYGAAASDQQVADEAAFFTRYESITKQEYERAAELDVPVYVLVDKAVHAEYQTFRANRDNDQIRYAHVDSVNVFRLIDEILNRPQNNPVHTFEKFTEIEEWLREQWAGLFRDLLKRSSQHAQLRALNEQVAEMRELNETLKNYMETVVTTVAPGESTQLISAEDKRRADVRVLRRMTENPAVRWLAVASEAPTVEVAREVEKASSLPDLRRRLERVYENFPTDANWLDGEFREIFYSEYFLSDINDARSIAGRPKLRRARQPRGEDPNGD